MYCKFREKYLFCQTFNMYTWIILLQHIPPMKIDDLFEDIKDGVRLLCLLEVLTGQKLVRLYLQSFTMASQEDNKYVCTS